MEIGPGPNRTGALVLLLPLLLLTLAGCGGSDSGSVATGGAGAVQHPPEVQQAIDELEGQVGFRPIAPTYFPEGMDSAPETVHVRSETQQTAIISFFPLFDTPATAATPTIVEITGDPASGANCPLCPSEGFTELEISGESALAEEGSLPEEGLVYYVLHFVVGDLLLVLNAEWNIPEGSGLTNPTAEMKQELVLVAESMLAQG